MKNDHSNMENKDLDHFEREGYVIIKGLLDGDTVDIVRRGANRLVDKLATRLLSEGYVKSLYQDEPFDTRLLKLTEPQPGFAPLMYRQELHEPEFFHLFAHEKILKYVQLILSNADSIRIYPNYSLRPKLPNYEPHDVVWHQDAGLTASGTPATTAKKDREEAFGRYSVVNCWTPLVKITEQNGALKVIPGSHQLGILEHQNIGFIRKPDEGVNYGLYFTTVQQDAIQQHEHKTISLECEPGDVIFFSNFLIHRGGFNRGNVVRWSLDWRYQDAGKPTLRDENGHVLWSRDASDSVVKNSEDWAKLDLM